MKGHVLWDWNGTLLDDTSAALATLNTMLIRRKLPTISLAFYQRNFRFPVKPFYTDIGISSANLEQWNAIAAEYHEEYARQPKRLNSEALAALSKIEDAGIRQSILSALRQDLLEAELKRFKLDDRFECIVGSDNLNGDSKLVAAEQLVAKLDRQTTVLIGDSLHDAEVARKVGIDCILTATGTTLKARLEEVALAVESLDAAVSWVINKLKDVK